MAETEAQSLLRQIKAATYIGLHKGNYGLRHYLSAEQKALIERLLEHVVATEPV